MAQEINFSKAVKMKPELMKWPEDEARAYVENINFNNNYFAPIWEEIKLHAKRFSESLLI